MTSDAVLIERGIPDLIASDQLAPVVAAEVDFLAGRHATWTERGSPMIRARAWVASGNEAEATALLGAIDVTACNRHELAAASWAVSRVGPPAMAEALLGALEGQPPFLFADDVPLGPRSLAQGPLLAATGDLTGAVALLEDAVVDGDARAPVWGALARMELARVTLCAQVVGDGEPVVTGRSVDHLLNASVLFFRAGGYRSLLARAGQLTHPDECAMPLGGPTVGRFRPGGTWRVGFGVMGDISLRPAKGLVMIRHLVQNPGRSVPAVVLDRVANGDDADDVEVGDEASAAEIRALLFDDAVRSRVGKLLSRTRSRIEDEHPLLAGHLRSTLRTGHACRYDPPSDPAVVWAV